MKKRKIGLVLLIIGIVLIIGGITSYIYINIIRDNNEQKRMENTILEDYEVFKTKTESFNTIRTNYSNDIVNDLFVENVEDNYDKWIEETNQYTKIVDEIENVSNNLKELCVNKFYSNKDVSNECTSFIISYETIMNYYTRDINNLNKTIDEYNNLKEKNKEEKELYNLKYNYTDINEDGKFVGKD